MTSVKCQAEVESLPTILLILSEEKKNEIQDISLCNNSHARHKNASLPFMNETIL